MENRDLIINLAYDKKGDYKEIYKALATKEYVKTIATEQAITMLDDNYPQVLKNSPWPPVAIFYQGDIDLLKKSKQHIGFVDDFNQTDTQEGESNRELVLNALTNEHICVLRHKIGKANKTLERIKNRFQNAIILICDTGIDLTDSGVDYVLQHKGLVISTAPSTLKEATQNSQDSAEMLHAYLSDIIYVNEILKDGVKTIMYALSRNGQPPIATSPYSNFPSLRWNNDLIKYGCDIIIKKEDFTNLYLI